MCALFAIFTLFIRLIAGEFEGRGFIRISGVYQRIVRTSNRISERSHRDIDARIRQYARSCCGSRNNSRDQDKNR